MVVFLGLEIRLADSSFLNHGRTRVQINEGVEIIVSVKNERNLASLTVYGDIEGQELSNTNINSSSNEIYITAGVVCILIFCETRTKRSVEVYRGRNLDPPPSPQTVTDTLRTHHRP